MHPHQAVHRIRAWLAAIALSATAAVPLRAQLTMSDLRVSGFGGWGAGRTNHNRYLFGDSDGDYSHTDFGVLLSTPVADRVAISALISWRDREQEQTAELTYAFATIRLTQSLDLRIGKVRFPGPLYSEVYDIGTVRPFLTLPQTIYGGSGNSMQNYVGAGLNGNVFAGGWDFGVAAYGGGGQYHYSSNRVALYTGSSGSEADVPVEGMVGGAFHVRPPIAGLTVGVAGATLTTFPCGTAIPNEICPGGLRATVVGGNVEYVTNKVWVRSEFAKLRGGDQLKNRAYYIELAYFLTRNWQVAGQVSALTDRFIGSAAGPIPLPSDLDRHREKVVGLNYWLAPNVVLKTSVHAINGLRFARPEGSVTPVTLMSSGLEPKTRLVQSGLQFTF